MAEKDELAQLREDLTQQQVASMTLLDIVKGIDRNVTEIVGSVRSIQLQQAMVDVRLNAMDARLNAVDSRVNTVDARVSALTQDMANSFRQVAETMATKSDLEELRTQVLGSFQHVLAILDERLPKKEE